MHTSCPQCQSNHLQVTYTVIKTAKCTNCRFFEQHRVTGDIEGGLHMIKHIVDQAVENNCPLDGLAATLTQQLAKISRREAKRRNRNNDGAPKRKEEWK